MPSVPVCRMIAVLRAEYNTYIIRLDVESLIERPYLSACCPLHLCKSHFCKSHLCESYVFCAAFRFDL